MGQAIAGVLTKGGATVDLVGDARTNADVTGDIVVLAVPYPALDDVLAKRADRLEGNVVVDITNPLNFETFDSLTVAADGSAAAELAQRLPSATVLKAFKTTFAATLASGSVGAAPTTVLIAGDDVAAKPGVGRPRDRRWPAGAGRRIPFPRARARGDGLPPDHPGGGRATAVDGRVRRPVIVR